MAPAPLYGHHQPLHRQVLEACQGWTIALCSANAQVQVITTLLLEQALVGRSIADLLAQLPDPTPQLLLIADDELPDGGADLLLEQLRSQRSIGRVRGLIYLPKAVPTPRLQHLWSHGADALLSLESGGSGLGLRAVLDLVAGRPCIDPAFDRRLRQGPRHRGGSPQPPALRAAEQELLLALARGRSTHEIAALRQVRCDTVRRQRSQLYRKAGVADQRGLLAWALAQGLLRAPDLVVAPPAG
ncbi:MAG: helix-turn-helix transcriptional regulator [Vulcanococcus sp.]